MDTIKFDKNNVKVVAHRGLSGLERENTCPSFVAAGNRSYFGIETDVHVTADGKFVIIHDETTKRVSLDTFDVNVENANSEEIEKVFLPDLDGSYNRRDIRIPFLSDYIKICKKYEKVCVLELKNHFVEEDTVRLIDEIKSLEYLDSVIFISFDLDNCRTLRKLLPDAQIQWLLGNDDPSDEIIKILVDNKFGIDIYYKALNEDNVKKLHSKGIEINCWTCDDKVDGEYLANIGVDYITSNILE